MPANDQLLDEEQLSPGKTKVMRIGKGKRFGELVEAVSPPSIEGSIRQRYVTPGTVGRIAKLGGLGSMSIYQCLPFISSSLGNFLPLRTCPQ